MFPRKILSHVSDAACGTKDAALWHSQHHTVEIHTAESRVESHGKTAAVVIEGDGKNHRRAGTLDGWSGVHLDACRVVILVNERGGKMRKGTKMED